jgi:hypothetical protein
MTNNNRAGFITPFIARYAQPLPTTSPCPARYDSQRQISQVMVSGVWMDAPDAPASAFRNTICTKVRQETTDDA